MQKIGFVFTGISGAVLHFVYEWTGEALFLAPFVSVNESTWEHMKLLFYPMLVYAMLEYSFFGKNIYAFWCVKLYGIVVGLVAVPIIYYTCIGVSGALYDIFNVAIFYIAVAAAYTFETYLFEIKMKYASKGISLLLLFTILLCFVYFTFYPPKLPLFKDPIDGTFGI